MKAITAILIIGSVCSLVLLGCVTKIGPTCNLRNDSVESVIAAKAKALNGKEYCQFRHYQMLFDVDRDGTDDFIVLFTVEDVGGGGNNHHNFMAIFLSKRGWKPIITRTGGRGERDPIAVDFRDGKIILYTLVYLPSDALCCPSGKGTLIFEVRGDNLELISEKTQNAEPTAPADRR
jgi:hypothetical protein